MIAGLALAVLSGCGGSGTGTAPSGTTTTAGTQLNTGPAPWRVPINSDYWIRQAGLPSLTAEGTGFHIHAHLDIFVDGRRAPVAANIGVNRVTRTLSPLHTHEANGIIHIEADEPDDFTLGQFFTQWAVRLDQSCVGGYCRPRVPWQMYVNGEVFPDDPATMVLKSHDQIAIVVGRPPPEVPAAYDFPEGF